MGEGQEENAIVTSTGQFVVAWDFAKVKKGHLDKYEIKKWVHVQKALIELILSDLLIYFAQVRGHCCTRQL